MSISVSILAQVDDLVPKPQNFAVMPDQN